MKPLRMIYCRTGKPSSVSDVVDTHQLQYDCSQKASISLIGVGLLTLSEKEIGTICKTNGKWSLKKQKEIKTKKKRPKQSQCHRLISTDPCIRPLILFGVRKYKNMEITKILNETSFIKSLLICQASQRQ